MTIRKRQGQKVQITCGEKGCGHVYDEGVIKPGFSMFMGVSGIITGMFLLHEQETGHSTIISSRPDIVKADINATGGVRVELVQ